MAEELAIPQDAQTGESPAPVSFWSKTKQVVPTASAVVVGLVFVVAGALKVYDPFSFYTQIRGYQIVGHGIAKLMAFLLPPLELGLGLAAVIGFKRRWACLGMSAMLVMFLAATAHAWITGTTDNCGCFGEFIARSPKATFFEDLAFLSLAVLGIPGKDHLTAFRGLNIRSVFKLAAVAFVVLLSYGGSLWAGALKISAGGRLKPGLHVSGWRLTELSVPGYEKKGRIPNLMKGTHLIILYSPLCKHCWLSVERVHQLSKIRKLDSVFGLAHDRGEKRFFALFVQHMKESKADYPLFTMPYKQYREMNQSVPKSVLIKTGVVRLVINGVPPAKAMEEYLR